MVYRFYVFYLHSKNLSKLCFFRLMQFLLGLHTWATHMIGPADLKLFFSWCKNLTDKPLKHLKDMPLTSVDFSECSNLTDKAIEQFRNRKFK